MKPLPEWIEDELDTLEKIAATSRKNCAQYTRGHREGHVAALHSVLDELKAREEAAKDQGPEILALADRAKTLHQGAWSILMALTEKCLKMAEGPPQKVTWWGGRPHINKLNAEPAKKEILALAELVHDKLTKADKVAHDLVLQALHWRGYLMSLMSGRITYKEAVELSRELGISPSGPMRADRIKELRRDLAVAGDAKERSKISQELLDAEDDYHDYTGISRREAKMTEADLDRAAENCGAEDEKENI